MSQVWALILQGVALLVTIVPSLPLTSAPTAGRNRVLLVSFDGFRWDYLQKRPLNNFRWVANRGVSAEKWMENVFTTLTFPAHFSMATGLYEESHGIVGNFFFDKKFNATFKMNPGALEEKWWQSAEPIWITTTRANIPSGTLFWPGSEVPYKGLRQEKYLKFNASMSFEARVDQVVTWMMNDHLRFLTLYFEEPDSIGHKFGPESQELLNMLDKMDQLLGYLIAKLQSNGLMDETNLILVSDHGMETVPIANVVSLTATLKQAQSDGFPLLPDMSRVERFVTYGVIFSFDLRPDNPTLNDEFITKFKAFEKKYLSPHFTVYKRNELPNRWHYKENADRVSDVLVIAEPQYLLLNDIPLNKTHYLGNHGFDNNSPSMAPIFLMTGPNILKIPRKVKDIHQVDLYGLICQLLNIPITLQAPNNGSTKRIKTAISAANKRTGCNQAKAAVIFNCIVIPLAMIYI